MVRTSCLLLVAAVALGGCYGMRGSSGAGETSFYGTRPLEPAHVALPAGYRVEVVASGLTFPTGVAFDDRDRVYVTEAGYSYGEIWTTPRLLRIEPDGGVTTVAAGSRNGPWNGVTYHNGAFYVAEGGELEGGAILRITPEGNVSRLVTDLPSRGDHHTNDPVVGPDGWISFGQGTATNAGADRPAPRRDRAGPVYDRLSARAAHRAHIHRLSEERPRHDGHRRLVAAGAGGIPGCGPGELAPGRERRSSGHLHDGEAAAQIARITRPFFPTKASM